MDALIDARSLTKLYGPVIGVNDVTVQLPHGVHGLLGPNGAGKSTFLKLITGQLRPTEGRIEVLGQRPWNNTRLYSRIGFCPEQDAFWDFLTGFEFVEFLARMSLLEPAIAQRRTLDVMDLVGAVDFMHRPISGYSKGMRQRVKVAQALVHDPDLLILDEPLSGTDPIGRHEMTELIVRLGEQGKSILISSHVLHEVQDMTSEFLLIFGGRVLASGDLGEIRGLMNEYPHRITIRCEQPRGLAHVLVRELDVTGVELDEESGELAVSTREPKAFYSRLPELALESGANVREMSSQDDNLDAVFQYLVGGR
jgi:ABC-2 type transport system ATP-binding protein